MPKTEFENWKTFGIVSISLSVFIMLFQPSVFKTGLYQILSLFIILPIVRWLSPSEFKNLLKMKRIPRKWYSNMFAGLILILLSILFDQIDPFTNCACFLDTFLKFFPSIILVIGGIWLVRGWDDGPWSGHKRCNECFTRIEDEDMQKHQAWHMRLHNRSVSEKLNLDD